MKNLAIRCDFVEIDGLSEHAALDRALKLIIGYDGVAVSAEVLEIIKHIRKKREFEPINSLLADYDLSSSEGILLMRLAEALLRIPDNYTAGELLSDKLASGDWLAHAGRSRSTIAKVLASALAATATLIGQGEDSKQLQLRMRQVAVKAARRAMRLLGRTFVNAETIEEAARKELKSKELFSYDMLGEAALTRGDVAKYLRSYGHAIDVVGKHATKDDCKYNSGISVKLSALHPRFEEAKRSTLLKEMLPQLIGLCARAAELRLPLTIDAEEAECLELSLDIFAAVAAQIDVKSWGGFGLAVQAYQPRAAAVIEELAGLAGKLDCRIMVRLVKGAYWDSEIKRAQELGVESYPVFTRKENTDVNYLACANVLLRHHRFIYPQFATHNAVTCVGVIQLIKNAGISVNVGKGGQEFEFQRLHGMGVALHRVLARRFGLRTRVYAPVGAHSELLPYLVRRLLENGANSSFVNRIEDSAISDQKLASDPVAKVRQNSVARHPAIVSPRDIYGETRANSMGFDLASRPVIKRFHEQLATPLSDQLVQPIVAGKACDTPSRQLLVNPADIDQQLGVCHNCDEKLLAKAMERVLQAAPKWAKSGGDNRATILTRFGDRLEADFDSGFELCVREAGKTWKDAVAEIREAIDFCRYYACEARRLFTPQPRDKGGGVIGAISPWNFPVAIFSGQIAGALAAGHGVIAKPAEQTPLCASWVVKHAYAAGVPSDVLSFLPGTGEEVGAKLVKLAGLSGVVFTGSNEVANSINRSLADNNSPFASLIAETGGINAMIVDSSALIEQVVRDIITSAFQSAGQRCSALRLLFVQEDIAKPLYDRLCGAMDELQMGDPADIATDIGPVIDRDAWTNLKGYCGQMAEFGKVIHKLSEPNDCRGHFVAPHLMGLDSPEELTREVFGPVLHAVTFGRKHLARAIEAINATGYGLTFGLASRIDGRTLRCATQVNAGNIYVNRNQIGAIVEANPFGGEGLSGTGPKAGGPFYVARLGQR